MSGMGILRRLFGQSTSDARVHSPAIAWQPGLPPQRHLASYGGRQSLEAVGESHYQDVLWRAVGGPTTERVRQEVQAVLFAEPDNPYDANAISVWIERELVGYLSREDAADYRPGLLALEAREAGGLIELQGVVAGGGIREDGLGFLGVWLFHDPADFGIRGLVPPPASPSRATMRTGLTEALLTDEEDDSYDLSWLQRLPSDPVAAITRLRKLLDNSRDPVERHFMFRELEKLVYRSRGAFASALADYDEICVRHDGEMDGIRVALMAKFGKIPLLETYKQMAIRHQKAKNWTEAIRWARRGLTLYADDAARPEAVEDLKNRVAVYSGRQATVSPEPGRPS
jgi:hypothetical protein